MPIPQNFGIQSITCEYGTVYAGQMGQSLKKHYRHIYFLHPQTLTVAEHSIDLCQWILLNDSSIQHKKSRLMDRIKKATNIQMNPNKMKERIHCLSAGHSSI
jgi:hypothetical protein